MKQLKVVILLLFVCLHTLSCSRGGDTLTIAVVSTDYSIRELKAAPWDPEACDPSLDNPYWGYDCYVSKSNAYGDEIPLLVVNNEQKTTVHELYGDNGYLLGSDWGEFAAGLHYYPYTGTDSATRPTTLLEDRCVALLAPPPNTDSYAGKHGYVVTGWNKMLEPVQPTAVYVVHFPSEENEFQCYAEKLCDVSDDSAVASDMSQDGTIYVACDSSLYAVTLEGAVTEIPVPDGWWDSYVNSIVVIGDTLYIGSSFGVWTYDISGNRNGFTWFPAPYEKK